MIFKSLSPEKNSIFLENKNTLVYLFVLVLFISFPVNKVKAQPLYTNSNSMVWDYIKRHADSIPPKKTRKRLEKFEHLINYYSTLSFSRAGHTVSSNFLRALVSAESAANPYAVSDKNAIGLSQITPATGKMAAKELYELDFDFKYVDEQKLKNLQPSDLFDPAINLLICVYLMDKYNRDYGNNLVLTISAWNAGPGSIKQYNGYPPYEETLNLVGRVNSYYHYYRKYYL